MKNLHRFSKPLLIIFLMLPFYVTGCSSGDGGGETSITGTGEEGSTSVDDTTLDGLNATEVDGLDATEVSHLTFMREEEKLARDVYLTLAGQIGRAHV